MSVVVIIPARYASTRLPGKALAEINGKPMIVHVMRRAELARGVDRVLIATDDERIAVAVEREGGEALMTSPHHASGTDRIAEVASNLTTDIIVNVQGDLPMLEPGFIEAAIAALEPAPEAAGEASPPTPSMSTLATPLTAEEAERSQVVKVVRDRFGDALYFSRSPIPFGGRPAAAGEEASGEVAVALRHIGLYAYRRPFLLGLAKLAPTPLERAERLEQLRVLEHGQSIRVAVVEASPAMIEVDTPEDLERVRSLFAMRPAREGVGSANLRERHG
jgi:3-deoxy-manno-octulosonate cytidylyltransferase (CMP-KDO synthetase)